MFIVRLTLLFAFLATLVSLVTAAPHTYKFITYDDDDDQCDPGWQRCRGTGFDTCVPGGDWVYQDCAPGTVCYQGWGAAKHHIWCLVPPTQQGY